MFISTRHIVDKIFAILFTLIIALTTFYAQQVVHDQGLNCAGTRGSPLRQLLFEIHQL